MNKRTHSEHIVLVHGLWCNRIWMSTLGRRLGRLGYTVHYFDYPSVRRSPAQNAAQLHRFITQLGLPAVHLVAHSLGGLVVLHFLQIATVCPIGKIVLLGTPVKGSEVAKRLVNLPLGSKLLGKSIHQGLTGFLPRGVEQVELGMIAGTVRLGLGLILGGVGEQGDGVVTLEETRLDHSKDHHCAPVSHTGLIFSVKVVRQIDHFLQHGSFRHI